MKTINATYEPSWLSWVAATTSCLKALGANFDTVDIAGYSGYAFYMTIPEKVSVDGPTCVDFSNLEAGLKLLGWTTLAFHGATCGGTPEDFHQAYDLVSRETSAGRPCVLWGAYAPEYAIAVGTQDKQYNVKSFKKFLNELEPPIPFDKLDVPGSVQVLAFPASTKFDQALADRCAIARAVMILNDLVGDPSGDPRLTNALAGYDTWIAAMKSGHIDPFGNSYNAQCWMEAKHYAGEFLTRLAVRNPQAKDALTKAAEAYREAATQMDKVKTLFPFPDAEKKVEDPKLRAQAADALKAAKASEARAIEALKEANKNWR